MGIDEVNHHDHSTDTEGGDILRPSEVHATLTESETLSTGSLGGGYVTKLRCISGGGGLVAEINPDSTPTPVQDAVDAVRNSPSQVGYVELPDRRITEEEQVSMYASVGIVGPGMRNTTDNATVYFPNPSDSGFLWPSTMSGNFARGVFGGFTIEGPGDDKATNSPMRFDTGANSCHFLPLEFRNWAAPAIHATGTGVNSLFQNTWDLIQVRFTDAGNHPGVIYMQGSGADSVIHNLAIYPTKTLSGANSTALKINAWEGQIGYLACGGSTGYMVDQSGSNNSGLRIGDARIEPTARASDPAAVIRSTGINPLTVGRVQYNGGTCDYVYELDNEGNLGVGNKTLGGVRREAGTINNSLLNIAADTESGTSTRLWPVLYFGKSGQVDNSTGATLTQPISCLGDLTTVS